MKRRLLVKTSITAAFFLMTAGQEALCVVVDKIAAVVNGEVITRRELARHLMPFYEEYRKEYTDKNLEEKMLEAEEVVMNQLIQDKLILSEAKKAGIKAEDGEVEERIKKIINERFGSDEKFREMLAVQNISLNEMKAAIRNEIIKSKIVRAKVGWKIVITPSEVRQYYDQHIDEFMEPERIEVFNILVRKKEDRVDEAKELIKKIKARLDGGEDFEAVAKRYSEGPNAKGGGSLGLVKRGEMIKEIDDTIFTLPVGGVSDIVESPIGYHIFKVTGTRPAKSKSFDSAKGEIEDAIYQKKIDKNLEKWLKELRVNAYISVK